VHKNLSAQGTQSTSIVALMLLKSGSLGCGRVPLVGFPGAVEFFGEPGLVEVGKMWAVVVVSAPYPSIGKAVTAEKRPLAGINFARQRIVSNVKERRKEKGKRRKRKGKITTKASLSRTRMSGF